MLNIRGCQRLKKHPPPRLKTPPSYITELPPSLLKRKAPP
nr:MAG TPA: hypothetical protein [Caudoviricetes sp.]